MQASADCRETKVMQGRGERRGCVGDALEITRPRRRAKASSATSMTPQTPLEISAGRGHRTRSAEPPRTIIERCAPNGASGAHRNRRHGMPIRVRRTIRSVPDRIFADARLAAIYDDVDGDRCDLNHYEAIVDELGARSVLDIGCGTGTLSCRLAARGVTVLGVDPAQASLAVARAKPGAIASPGCSAMEQRSRR